MIDKIRPYLDTKEIQEDLEDHEIAMVDGDEESTDPYVEATDVLERIHLITCQVQKKKPKPKESELIKDEGEGDWGTGETEIEDRPIQEGDLQLLPTDWPREFRPLRPRIRSGDVSNDTDPKSETDKDARVKGEVGKADPLSQGEKDEPTSERKQATCGSRHEGRERQKESVTQQQSEEQHVPNNRSTRPKLMGERIDKNKGRAYQPLQRHQDNQKKGLHVRPREQESGGEDPQAKVLKPCRVTRPRETETEGDKPPSKVLKPCRVTRPREAETEGDKPPSKVLKPCRITRPREAETEVDKPPSKVLKPCRVTRPREGETEGDKPPSKVCKSMQWVKSLFVRAPPFKGFRQVRTKRNRPQQTTMERTPVPKWRQIPAKDQDRNP